MRTGCQTLTKLSYCSSAVETWTLNQQSLWPQMFLSTSVCVCSSVGKYIWCACWKHLQHMLFCKQYLLLLLYYFSVHFSFSTILNLETSFKYEHTQLNWYINTFIQIFDTFHTFRNITGFPGKFSQFKLTEGIFKISYS